MAWPITLEEAKEYLRIEHSADDTLLQGLIDAVTENAAHVIGQAIPWPQLDEDGEPVLDEDDAPVMEDVPASLTQGGLLALYNLYEAARHGDQGTILTPAVMALWQPYRINVGV